MAQGRVSPSSIDHRSACAVPKLRAGMYCQVDSCATSGTGRGDLEYVGCGRGDFAVEPAMKYVGYGGDYSVRRGPNICCIVVSSASGLLLLLLGLLCYLFWPTNECLVQIDTYQQHWSLDKTRRCCARGYVPCIFVEPPVTPPPPPPPPAGPVDPFNCADGAINWQAGWSTEKKVWCCHQHGKGCGQDAEVPAAEYDCNAAFANWVKGWSEGKKQWCCNYGYETCPNNAAAAGAGYGAGTQNGANFHGAQVADILHIPYAVASQAR